MQAPLSTKPIRRVLTWQAIATVAVATIAGLWVGGHGALSAMLGGVVNIAAVVVYAVVLGISNPTSAGATVAAVFRAEAAKVLVIILQLWVVLVSYKNLVAAAFFVSFVITVLLFRMALLGKETERP